MKPCEQDANAEIYTLNERLDLAAAAKLTSDLKQLDGRAICINAEHVGFLGAIAAEALLSAKKTWDQNALGFHIVTPSEAFVSGWSLLGLPETFLFPEAPQ